MKLTSKRNATFSVEAVHPIPGEAYKMPYAPAVKIVGACDLMFLSGATASRLYHHHPHRDEEHVHPHSIEEPHQARQRHARTHCHRHTQDGGRPASR